VKRLELIVPPLSPFGADERLDVAAFEKLIEFLLARGVDAVFVAGTTGEFPMLSADERRRLFAVAAASGMRLIAHVGTPSTREAIELIYEARQAGAHALAAVTPYYFHYRPDELIRYYRSLIAAAAEVPLYAYTIPQLAGNDLPPEALSELAAAGLSGIKDSSGNQEKISEYLAHHGRFKVYLGADLLLPWARERGADGAVSGLAMVVPELYRALFEAWEQGDTAKAESLFVHVRSLADLLANGGRLELLRAALAVRGVDTGRSRAPLRSLDPAEEEGFRKRFATWLEAVADAGVSLL